MSHEPGTTPQDESVEPASEPSTSEQPAREVVEENAVIAGTADRSQVRRAPRFGAFLFAGLVLAAFVAGLLSFVRDSTLPPEALAGRALDSGGMFLLLLIVLGAFFALTSYGVAVWLDRRSIRRMERSRRP